MIYCITNLDEWFQLLLIRWHATAITNYSNECILISHIGRHDIFYFYFICFFSFTFLYRDKNVFGRGINFFIFFCRRRRCLLVFNISLGSDNRDDRRFNKIPRELIRIANYIYENKVELKNVLIYIFSQYRVCINMHWLWNQ